METICPLARPLLIALQVERTSFGFHVRECMRSSPPPQANMQKITSGFDVRTQPYFRLSPEKGTKSRKRRRLQTQAIAQGWKVFLFPVCDYACARIMSVT